MEVIIPLGTKVKINGLDVEFTTDAAVNIPAASSIDHAAELGAEKALGISLTHIQGGKEISYVSGKRSERVLPKEEPEKEEKTEKPKKTGTKAKPKG